MADRRESSYNFPTIGVSLGSLGAFCYAVYRFYSKPYTDDVKSAENLKHLKDYSSGDREGYVWHEGRLTSEEPVKSDLTGKDYLSLTTTRWAVSFTKELVKSGDDVRNILSKSRTYLDSHSENAKIGFFVDEDRFVRLSRKFWLPYSAYKTVWDKMDVVKPQNTKVDKSTNVNVVMSDRDPVLGVNDHTYAGIEVRQKALLNNKQYCVLGQYDTEKNKIVKHPTKPSLVILKGKYKDYVKECEDSANSTWRWGVGLSVAAVAIGSIEVFMKT